MPTRSASGGCSRRPSTSPRRTRSDACTTGRSRSRSRPTHASASTTSSSPSSASATTAGCPTRAHRARAAGGRLRRPSRRREPGLRAGAVGAGAGMSCFGWKGGIGTSSRRAGEHTVGVLLLDELRRGRSSSASTASPGRVPPEHRKKAAGSCIGVVATDAPLSPRTRASRAPRRPRPGARRLGCPPRQRRDLHRLLDVRRAHDARRRASTGSSRRPSMRPRRPSSTRSGPQSTRTAATDGRSTRFRAAGSGRRTSAGRAPARRGPSPPQTVDPERAALAHERDRVETKHRGQHLFRDAGLVANRALGVDHEAAAVPDRRGRVDVHDRDLVHVRVRARDDIVSAPRSEVPVERHLEDRPRPATRASRNIRRTPS